MAKSQQTFNKLEKEKKKLKKREEKRKKKEERKANSKKGEGFDSMIAYVDEYGQLTDTPPDPSKKLKVDASSIEIGIPKKEHVEEESSERTGKVSFFDSSKGFGFIIETDTQEKYFVHVSGVLEEIQENDKVTFELERGLKGMNAVQVKKV
ncbi:cold shock domain-containing protein [Flavobacteriaceae bacterium AH-315-O20]|nr:cold shock domain-containing protein [Flavobacteriaceae bacterium AH-315-O20]